MTGRESSGHDWMAQWQNDRKTGRQRNARVGYQAWRVPEYAGAAKPRGCGFA